MKFKQLGQTSINISTIGLGCMGMSMGYGKSDDASSLKTLHHALDLGINFFDTADVYGAGHNELLLNKAFSHSYKKHEIIIASKCGLAGIGEVNGRPEYIKQACDASLRRLGLDVLDLYYLHRVDKTVPVEDSIGAFVELQQEGKIKHIGLSEVKPETLQRALAVSPISALQSEYSLWERKPEKEILSLCKHHNITFVAYCPLGRGVLSGQYRDGKMFQEGDFRTFLPKFTDGNIQHNLAILDKIKNIADRKGISLAQMAILWVLSQSENIVPIPGTRSIDRLNENIMATNYILSDKEQEQIQSILDEHQFLGKQYTDAFNLEA